ncbi:hypothetical protein GR212_32665 [Rhizobium lusitanum]|uniref:Uncharacterized protein n=1 Tax=Rhizobium lusitanum TaxID=293958 RepID=A0A6L9UKE3_9HYPH|nr:hypothetical protein [Rhizobium lusitanum]NEI74310.1 hypothetical protein [Rhizobium lusitanum]
MSTLSLLSGAETLALSFQLLIDEVLLSGDTIEPVRTARLAHMLREAAMARGGNGTHEGLLFDSLLRDIAGNSRSNLEQLASIVEMRPIPNSALQILGEIADQLSHERLAFSTRMSPW